MSVKTNWDGTNPLLKTRNLTWDNTNNVFRTTKINIPGKITTILLGVPGNINIQNSSNPNNTIFLINSETNSYNSKLSTNEYLEIPIKNSNPNQ